MRRASLHRLEAAHERWLEDNRRAYECFRDVLDRCDRAVTETLTLPLVAAWGHRVGMSYGAARVQLAWWRDHVVLSRSSKGLLSLGELHVP